MTLVFWGKGPVSSQPQPPLGLQDRSRPEASMLLTQGQQLKGWYRVRGVSPLEHSALWPTADPPRAPLSPGYSPPKEQPVFSPGVVKGDVTDDNVMPRYDSSHLLALGNGEGGHSTPRIDPQTGPG